MADVLSGNVRSLQETLRSKSPHKASRAAQLSSDLYQLCVESVTDTELAYSSSVLFDKSTGILVFLRESVTLDEFATAQEELLRLLNDFIKILDKKVLTYAVEIKDVCVSLFSRAKASKVKNATFPPLTSVLELCGGTSQVDSLNVPKLVDKYLQACLKPTKHTATVRAAIFHILGLFCELYPEHMVTLSDRLIGIFMRTLKSEMLSKNKKPEMSVIGGCLRGLNSYLVNFSQSVTEGSEYAHDIYKFARMAVDTKVNHTRYEVPRAGLSLIANHSAQFKEYIAKDHEYMYDALYQWCGHTNRDNRLVAFLALESFLQQVSLYIVGGDLKEKQAYASVFKDFIKKFRAIIDNSSSNHRELTVAIKGYGYFAAPCKLFMKTEDIHYMFGEMVERSEHLFFSSLSEGGSDERLQHLPALMEALASIVAEMQTLSEAFMSSLEKLMVLLFEVIPHFPPALNKPTYHAVMRLIIGVADNRTALKSFLSQIVYQGLIRTCSHPVVIEVGDGSVVVSVGDAGGVRENERMDVGDMKQPSYLDYIQLWLHIMDPSKLKLFKGIQLRDPALRSTIHQMVYDEVISSVLKIIHRLNLSATASTTKEEEAPLPAGASESLPSSTHTDPVTGLLAAVPRDFQIFINLVDLCKTLLLKTEPLMFEQWVLTFGRDIIVASSHHPLVSGFYKLLATCLTLCKKIRYFQDVGGYSSACSMETDAVTDKLTCYMLFRKFTREVLVRMKQYKDDLLVSCLQLLLSLPNELVEPEFPNLVPALQTTFKLGLSYLPLAQAGLAALQAWSSQLPASVVNPHFHGILPALDDYLKTKGIEDGQGESGMVKLSRHSTGRLIAIKNVSKWRENVEGSESPHKKVQMSILHFLGSLGGHVNAGLVETGSLAVYARKAVAWDSQDHLLLDLPFQDIKPTICLDPFFPRVCELASSSSDRQTKIAACELLHAMVLFILGRSAQPAMQKKNPMTKLFRKVFPYILQLGCDVEKVAEQLFRPLVLQMIHWFTRNTQYESPDTIALLEAILNGIVDSSDTSLRDFCGLCVREFLSWSIKQTSKKQQEKSPINIKSLLKRLYSLASHPSASKRLGAALAFNNIYTVFREEDSLVDVFVIEMLVVLIHSLKMAHRDEKELGTQEQCIVAIGHIARIIRVKSTLLNKVNKKRRIPKGLNAADLFSVVRWLLTQCGSPETACRVQCRELFIQLAPLLPKTASSRTWIKKTMDSEHGYYFIARFEKGGHAKGGIQGQPMLTGKVFSLSETCAWLESLLAALDCYNWFFEKQLLDPNEVFLLIPDKSTEKPSCLFTSIEHFLSKLALYGIKAAVQCFESSQTVVHTPKEIVDYNSTKCSVILALLHFVSVLLTKHPKDAFSRVPKTFWTEPLLKMIVTCSLQPTSAGFNIGDVIQMNSLTTEVLDCLKALHVCEHFPPEDKSLFLELLRKQLTTEGACNLIGQLPLLLDTEDHSQLNNIIHGHLLLQKSSLLPVVLKQLRYSEETVVSGLVQSVLNAVRPLVALADAGNVAATLTPVTAQTTSLLLELALLLGISPPALVDLLFDGSTDCSGIGLMLYQCFSNLINSHILAYYQDIISTLLQNGSNKLETLSAVLNGVLEHMSRDKTVKKERVSSVCLYLLSKWNCLEGWWKGDTDHQLAAISLLRKILSQKPSLLQKAPPFDVQLILSMYSIILEDPQSSLSCKSRALEIVHHFVTLSEESSHKIRASLDKLNSHQFPLKSSEFIAGSPQYNEYISVIDKLLTALVTSRSFDLLEVIMSVMCRETKHAHEDHIQNSLTHFMKEIPTASEKKKAIDVAYQFFTNERDYPLQGRRAAAERVCVTLMKSCDEVALREFFLDHVRDIMAVIEASLSKSTMESQLVCKICCFNFMEVLYQRLPSGALSSLESKINKAYCKDNTKTGKELTQALTKAGHLAKGEDLHGDRTLCELRRQYHCAAYNVVAAVISCTQKDIRFFTTFLFKEDLTKGQYLWDNLIDPDRVYHFDIELETPIDRKKQLTAIRNEFPSEDFRESSPLESPLFPPRYLSSQYLADSSLSTDISQFDFSGGPQVFPVVAVASKSEAKEMSYTVSEEQIEQDELNMHECMLPLMKLIDHMEHNKINPVVPQGSVPDDLPSWMACIQKKLLDTRTHLNVQLLLSRLITHRPKVFQPYAKYWLPCLINLILKTVDRAVGMQYFVVDIVVTLLSWASTATPERDGSASRLLEYLMHNCHHDNRSIFRNNLEIIKTMLELWRDRLQAPTKVIYNHFCNPNIDAKSNRTGIQLLGVVVANRITPYDPSTSGAIDERKFYSTFVSLMSHKYKELYAAAAEVLGMVLSYLDEQQHASFDNVKELVVNQLLSLCGGGNEDKFLICINKIQINFPRLIDRFVEKLLFMLPAFHGVFRSMCLEVLLSLADVRPTLYQELKEKGFHDMLKFRDEPTQLAALKVSQRILQNLQQEQLTELLPLLREFSQYTSQKCREVMYDILIWIYNNTCSSSTDVSLKAFTSDVHDQLLQGLSDDAEAIRMKMFEFWNQESRLASNTLGRLTQLLPVLYSTGIEKHFLYHSTNLLLELTSRSPDYNRSMFDQPLSECKFEEYRGIDLSWQQRYSQMTPLFAASLSSQPGQTQTDGGGTLGSSVGSGAIRATQKSMDFTPTQDGGGYNWMAPSLQSQDTSLFSVGSADSKSQTQPSSLLFNMMKPPKRRPLRAVTPGDGFGVGRLGKDETDTAKNPKEQQRTEIMKLKRRFLKDRKVTSAYFARSQSKQKIMREENRKRQKAARNSKVVMYRKYRVGELPDTQIKYSEIIRPFQALAQRDSNLARMLFSTLYRSLFAMVDRELTETEAETTVKTIKDGLNAVLESSTEFCAPFIGSLHDLCFHEKQLELKPTAVATACLYCMQEPVGIMLLEKQLLINGESANSGRSAKRARTTSSTFLDHTITTWVEMSRLYKSLGDYDTLRGIFSSQVGIKKITQEALAAEERADYVEALRLYKEAVGCENWSDGDPNQVEEDLWDDSMLECYSHLTEWQDLEKTVMVNIDESGSKPKLIKIWDDPYHQEHYLPHMMRAKLKLACSGIEDSNFTEFLNSSLKESEKKDLLESRYSIELALYSIIRGDLDRAKYYNDNSLELFLQDWSNLDVLLVKSRSTRLQDLQLLTEIHEFIQFMNSPANFESVNPVYRLLSKWQSRFPHPKLDPLDVWDDIVTTRCMMMRKLVERFRSSPSSTDGGLGDSMEVDGGGVSLPLLQERFSLEYTKLYMKIATVARQHCNYAVCRKYLGLTEKAINDFFPGDSKLRLDWLHSVSEMKIQQAEQDPSPTKMEPLVALLDKLELTGKDSFGNDHTLARRHYLLEGRAFDILAKAFSDDDGQLIMNVLHETRVVQLNKMIGLPTTARPPNKEITHKLFIKSLAALKSATKSGTAEMKETNKPEGMVEALMDMALFCDRALKACEDEEESTLDTDQFPSVVVMYSLKAMRYGCRTAVQRFPRLLQLLELYPVTRDDFKKKCSEVPHWMFIGWISQILPLMDKPVGEAIEGILHSIAVDYPQAISYPFKISQHDYHCDNTDDGKQRLGAINKLKDCLNSKLVDDFVTALEQLNSPELAWKDMLETELQPLMEQTLSKRSNERVHKIWLQIYNQLLDYKTWDSGPTSSLYGTQSTASLLAGDRMKRFAREHLKRVEKEFGGKDGTKLLKMTSKTFVNVCKEMFDGMRPTLNKSSGPGLLKDYSPWLHNFHTNSYTYVETIEVPGQYNGCSEPLPQYHVKIAGFDEKVLVMSSLRKPKRLTIRGNDEKDHMFLVKAGEDLRLDQRIEELFEVMNGILTEDPACSQRGLSLRTYRVIPMTPRVGMIEWVENTKPLKGFMQSALTDDEKKYYANGLIWYDSWLKKYKGGYKGMYREASKTEVEKEYRKKVLAAPWDMLRRAFFKLSSSPEAFLTLRSHFIRTHATLSICHYILGIGDRHLSNFMIDLESGASVGIDFGHAFGTATQFLHLPELIPFRLTPQITNLILPHFECGQLRSCMTHVLRALRNSPGLLLCTMDIFVKEPLLDWKSNARKQAKAQKLDAETFSQEGSWYPKEKLKQAEKKLLGYNSAHIMRTDLKNGHERTLEYPALEKILMGDRKYSHRAKIGERCSSVEEQVVCLIDHATDPDILGRTWQGWEPWI